MMHFKLFKHNILENKNKIETKTIDGIRHYVTPSGNVFPSVTSVVGYEKNIFFAEWRKNNPRESRRVTDRGTKLHSLIESYLKNELTSLSGWDPNITDLFVQMKNNVDCIDNIVALETALWSEKIGLAGRVDCIAEYNGTLSIIDFKGSTREKRKEDIDNYYLQATAYALMWEDMTNTRIDNFHIIIGCENSTTAQLFSGNPKDHVDNLKCSIDKFIEAEGVVHE